MSVKEKRRIEARSWKWLVDVECVVGSWGRSGWRRDEGQGGFKGLMRKRQSLSGWNFAGRGKSGSG